MSEADDVLEEQRRVFVRGKHLESEQANTDNVIAEDESTEDIRILAVLLCGLLIA